MLRKNMVLSFAFLMVVVCYWMNVPAVHATNSSIKSPPLDYVGKSYPGDQDSSYLNYDLALREYMVYRINKRFGITLDPKTYSGFDLLEMEALFKCKKKEESFDSFFKKFPKNP